MRKVSTKPKKPNELPISFAPHPLSSGVIDLQIGKAEVLPEKQNNTIMYLTMPTQMDYQILDILIRVCDACHEMDNKTEPWATIRKDIEALK